MVVRKKKTRSKPRKEDKVSALYEGYAQIKILETEDRQSVGIALVFADGLERKKFIKSLKDRDASTS